MAGQKSFLEAWFHSNNGIKDHNMQIATVQIYHTSIVETTIRYKPTGLSECISMYLDFPDMLERAA